MIVISAVISSVGLIGCFRQRYEMEEANLYGRESELRKFAETKRELFPSSRDLRGHLVIAGDFELSAEWTDLKKVPSALSKIKGIGFQESNFISDFSTWLEENELAVHDGFDFEEGVRRFLFSEGILHQSSVIFKERLEPCLENALPKVAMIVMPIPETSVPPQRLPWASTLAKRES